MMQAFQALNSCLWPQFKATHYTGGSLLPPEATIQKNIAVKILASIRP
jgi:hypothetical protein